MLIFSFELWIITIQYVAEENFGEPTYFGMKNQNLVVIFCTDSQF